jgi:hypothetical protein
MANTIRLKRRAAGGAAGAPVSLAAAEPAYNEQDDTLYYGKGDSGGNATSIIPIGGRGAFADLTSDQTIGGAKTFSTSPILPTPATGDDSTKAATTAFVKAQGYQTGNQPITLSGDISGSGSTSIAGTLATVNSNVGTYTKVTVNAKGLVTAATNLLAADIPTLTASKISDLDAQVRASRLDQMAAPSAAVSLNAQKITNLLDPTSAQDAATKAYVDSVAQGLDAKGSVKAATTANITLSGAQTVDGVSVVAGDRVLVKNQSTASQNGVYVGQSGAWTRALDMDVWSEVPNAFVFVEQGTTQADTGWVCTADQGGTLGTTSVPWTQFSSAASYVAGAGLTLTGNVFDVVGTANRITVNADSIDIAATYVGQTSITTLGTVTTGAWNGAAVGVAYGGTGATTLTGLVKGNGTSAFTAAVAGTDYLSPSSTIDGGTF